ncbi:MAG: leucyl aminopeptidase [Halobacteriovoraceae bacterium]|nr:leucyl aminopeptidase [Halobacteriovoraceae bacterium]
MEIKLNLNSKEATSSELVVLGSFATTEKKGKKEVKAASLTNWPKEVKDYFSSLKSASSFNGDKGAQFFFDFEGTRYLAFGLGEKKALGNEDARKTFANVVKAIKDSHTSASFQLDTMMAKGGLENTASILTEALELTTYFFDKYLSNKKQAKLKKVNFDSKEKKTAAKKIQNAIDEAQKITESVNVARNFVNEPPNILNSESYAKEVLKDVKGIKGVKAKVLGKADLKKHKMGMFLSVNAGSAYEPQLVHLTYTPSKVTKNTKHIAFVGKGLTFDTGGYSLKPGGSMVNMKFDMAGSATVYGAFRAAALLGLPVKVSCFLGMTDNAVNSLATMPDSIVTAMNGKTVEILNTDAEGRLVMGDVLTYASNHKPDVIIDSATLTGACLVALGTEVCGLMGNDDKLKNSLKKAAGNVDEYIWELPIMQEWRDDMKSNIADLKNIGSNRFAGTPKAAAFLENFVGEGIAWAHLDIAGCGDSQAHLPYCPPKGASGVMVRTLVEFMRSQK